MTPSSTPLSRAAPPWAFLAALAATLAWPGEAGEGERELARARAYQARVQRTIARVRSSVVAISLPSDGRVRSGGSGVLISAEGWVLTCDHVVDEGDEVLVGLADGRTLEGRVIGRDPVGDVALVKVPEREGLTPARLGDSRALRRGDVVLALGNPFGLAADDLLPAATLGIVSGLHRAKGGRKVYGDAIQHDAAVNPGNSGGPLFDLAGRLVGINGRISIRGLKRHNVGVGFAIPLHQILPILPQLREGKTVGRGWLGVRFKTTADDEPGALIESVTPNSPAARAGLRPGERVMAVNGRPIEHPVRFKNEVSLLPAGARVKLRLRGEEGERTLVVVLGERAR